MNGACRIMQVDQIIINDILNEYYNKFKIQKNKIINSSVSLENNLIIDQNADVAKLINKKIMNEFEKFIADFSKLEDWWRRYLESVNELNNGLVSNVNSASTSDSNYLEARNLLSNEIE